MDILLGRARRGRKIAGLGFGDEGPSVDGTPLLHRRRQGFEPRSLDELETLFKARDAGTIGLAPLAARLAVIARALNAGDVALAAIATSQLRLPAVEGDRLDPATLRKASPDDPIRPGWPAKTPGGLGGKFRPRNAQAGVDSSSDADRLARLDRLEARRGIRSVLRRVLTARRMARLLLEGAGEAVPGYDALDSAALAEDLAEIATAAVEESVDVEAATAFVKQGPRSLDDLMMSGAEEDFRSFDAFEKDALDKRFGPAGAGYEYHHIVEQGAAFAPEQLQSTANIVRIPRLLHEEVNAAFALSKQAPGGTSLRDSLRGATFEAHRRAGLDVLRAVGVLYP